MAKIKAYAVFYGDRKSIIANGPYTNHPGQMEVYNQKVPGSVEIEIRIVDKAINSVKSPI